MHYDAAIRPLILSIVFCWFYPRSFLQPDPFFVRRFFRDELRRLTAAPAFRGYSSLRYVPSGKQKVRSNNGIVILFVRGAKRKNI